MFTSQHKPVPRVDCHLSNYSYVANPNLAELSQDFLYHINLGTKSHNLKEMFSGVKVSSESPAHPSL